MNRQPPPLARPASMVLTLVLATAVVHFGLDVVRLARKSELRDFSAYYTAAVVARSGGSFYDPQPGAAWFFRNENADLVSAARRLGMLHQHDTVEHVHIFSYPPAMMLVMYPLGALPPLAARALWLTLSLLALGGGTWLMGRTLNSATPTTLMAVFMVCTFHPVRNTLDLGQVNALLFLLVALFFACYRRGSDVAAGLALGLASAIRIHPVFLILYLGWRRELRPALVAIGAAVALTLVSVIAFGRDASTVYFSEVARKFSTALISVENHSLAGFLTTFGQALGWSGVGQEVSSIWTTRLAATGILILTAVMLTRPVPPRDSRLADLEFALVLVMIPLATPNTTINHLVTLLVSFWILAQHVLEADAPPAPLVPALGLAAALLIGAVDDYYMHPRLARSLLVLLAGVKFYGLVLLYLALALAMIAVRRRLCPFTSAAMPGAPSPERARASAHHASSGPQRGHDI